MCVFFLYTPLGIVFIMIRRDLNSSHFLSIHCIYRPYTDARALSSTDECWKMFAELFSCRSIFSERIYLIAIMIRRDGERERERNGAKVIKNGNSKRINFCQWKQCDRQNTHVVIRNFKLIFQKDVIENVLAMVVDALAIHVAGQSERASNILLAHSLWMRMSIF